MPDISAVAIREVCGSQISDDGQNMLLKTILSGDGSEAILAIPRSEILKLVELASLSQKQSDEILKTDPMEKPIFRVSWWEIGFDQNTKSAVLTLTFGSEEGSFSFQLWGTCPRLYSTLYWYMWAAPLSRSLIY